ncbi:hypothetical protein N0V90_003303 [Kalmusia sp. IMI 367209]|nr:hypothetical protein N0V90_003303 [Kalmusia sp. IMI 367209]
MGNAQSSGHPHNRLVKPKTNTNSPSLAPNNGPNVDSPVSLSSRYAHLSMRDRQQIKSQLLSPIETDFGYRESWDGEENLGEIAANVQRRLSTRSNSLSCFGSKANSTTRLSSLPASKVSLVQSSQPVDLEAAISILQEVQKNASPDDVAAIREQEPEIFILCDLLIRDVTEPGLSHRTSTLNRSTSSLTRRRSLAITPGVATRNSPIESNRRTWNSWRTPQLDSQEEAKWRHHDMVGSSPLTRIAALDLAEEGRESPTPRAQTPADMEISHLGSLKLGTLRIANGEPSPAASTKLNWYAANTATQDEDYFAAPESLDSPIMMKPTRKRRHVRSKSALQPPTPPLYRNLRVPDEARKAKTTSRYAASSQVGSLQQTHHAQSHFEEIESEPVRRLRVMNKSQDTLATTLDSQPDISSNDYSECAQPISVQAHDEGFASDDGTSFRNEAIRIFDGTIFSEPVVESSSPEAQCTPSVNGLASLQKHQKAEKRPPPKKADSGYSSAGSFRAKQGETWKSGTTQTIDKKPSTVADLRQSESGSDKDDSTSLYTFEQMLRASTPQASLPPSPADEHVNTHPIHLYSAQEGNKSTLVLATSALTNQQIDGSSLGLQAPKTPRTPASVISQFSIDSKNSTHKRLQKKKPSFQELPVVQSCDPIPEGSIPSIPIDVRSQFIRRLSETPGMEYLVHTYPAKNHANDEEIEKELPPLEPLKFPSPPATPEPRGRHHKRAATERPSSPRRSLRRSLSLFRRKSKFEKEEIHPPLPDQHTVLDLGTTAASLGRSPYDVALAAAHQKRMSSPTHPHQLGDAMLRAKSMVNMDSRTAAKLARFRSKDRALLRPEMPQRPKSYYSDREAKADADIYRRHSFYGHASSMTTTVSVPTVPAMPTTPSVGDVGAASHAIDQYSSTKTNTGQSPRAPTTGRGRVVTPLIEKFDNYAQRVNDTQPRSHTMDGSIAYRPLRSAAAMQGSRT